MLRLKIYSLFILFSCTLCAYSQSSTKLENLGFIGNLTYYKLSAEEHAIRIFNHKKLSDASKSVLLSKYNELRICNEQMLLQLIADLHTRKRLAFYKKIDKYFLCKDYKVKGKLVDFVKHWNSFVSLYQAAIAYPDVQYLDSLKAEYTELQNKPLNLKEKGTSLGSGVKINIFNPIETAGSLLNVYKNITFGNEQKASNITELLNNLRLRNAAELIADEHELLETKLQGKQ